MHKSHEEAKKRIGRVLLDRFELTGYLGDGATATVYRAMDRKHDRTCAIKLVKVPDYQTADQRNRRRARFKREAEAIAKLNHPNVVRLYYSGELAGGQQFMALEYLDGTPWSERVRGPKRPDKPSLTRIARIGQRVAEGLTVAHAAGIIHRDIKPANIVLVQDDDDEQVKVVDFGAAAFDPERIDHTKLTRAGATVGSAPYMSPEQARSEELAAASDVYSLGIVLFEAITGDVPFHGSFVEVMSQHNFEPPPPLNIPGRSQRTVRNWQQLLFSMLAKDPKERPSMAAVATALRRLGRRRVRPASTKSVAAWALATVLVGAGLMALAWAMFG